MAKNKIEDLRDHLFATLEALRDKEEPMDIDRALAIAEVGKVIVDSAKTETQHLKALGDIGVEVKGTSEFIPSQPRQMLPPARPETRQ